MNADPADGPDPFSRVLPLPFRLELQLILGFWLWGLNLHGFALLDIDIATLIRFPSHSPDDDAPLYIATYRLASVLTTVWAVALVVFWYLTANDVDLVVTHDWIPHLALIVILVLLLLPRYPLVRDLFGSGSTHGLARLGTGLRRIALGGIAVPKPEKFGDVLLADALTSYAKPISEIFVAACMFATGRHTTDRPDRLCGHSLLVPLAIAWPFVVRLRQCLIERQYLNALKYATAFPVIVFSAMARTVPSMALAWRFAALVNSSYSFWWDVTMDWDLTLLAKNRHTRPYGLRSHRGYASPMLYYVVVAVDLVLRFTWSMKLSLHLIHLDGIEGGIFLLELLELARRWMWVYFRVETEFVRSNVASAIEL